jgi:hypothetical protein
MPLGLGMDLTMDVGQSRSAGNAGPEFLSKFAGGIVRGALSAETSAGISYRWNRFSTTGIGTVPAQTSQSVDVDLTWFPSTIWGLSARANYFVVNGSVPSQFISPFIDLRWTPNATSSATLRYNFSKSKAWDPLQGQFLSQGDRGLSARLTHQVTRDSTLDLVYDFLGSDAGDLEWQRSLRIYFGQRL